MTDATPRKRRDAVGVGAKSVTFAMPASLVAQVDAYALDHHITRSAAIRELARLGVESLQASAEEDSTQAPNAEQPDTQEDPEEPTSKPTTTVAADPNDPAPEVRLVAYASEHPLAKKSELARAIGVSEPAARAMVRDLEADGRIRNVGTSHKPVWEIPGVEHGPEDLITEEERALLEALSRDHRPSWADIAWELGVSESKVYEDRARLAELGLARRDSTGRWVATGSACV
jgi:hypothetical protein